MHSFCLQLALYWAHISSNGTKLCLINGSDKTTVNEGNGDETRQTSEGFVVSKETGAASVREMKKNNLVLSNELIKVELPP